MKKFLDRLAIAWMILIAGAFATFLFWLLHEIFELIIKIEDPAPFYMIAVVLITWAACWRIGGMK